ncbi:MAG: GspH/FimT family pseudopilin [Candidatus Edwardsbacteria bacterium]|jgi:prepilin-type N-terminal cleavage/methylation domain-containing protein|nr:GspH/FimT family pseudopilin [Candidatus Edwardsbacteria bacterium]
MKNKGFTLIELLVVVVATGILMAIAGVAFSGAIARGRIKGAASSISREMQNARERAISRGHPVDVVFSANPQGRLVMTINNIDTAATSIVLPTFTDCLLAVGAGVNQRAPETGAGAPVSAADFPIANTCRFLSQGTGSVGAIYITGTNNRAAFAIAVNANGRISVWEWGANTWNKSN